MDTATLLVYTSILTLAVLAKGALEMHTMNHIIAKDMHTSKAAQAIFTRLVATWQDSIRVAAPWLATTCIARVVAEGPRGDNHSHSP